MTQPLHQASGPYDLLIANATLVDGTAAPTRSASVTIRDDTIVAIGDLPRNRAARVIDASGLVLAPGFIDMHTRSDRTLLAYLDLLDSDLRALGGTHSMCEDDVRFVMRHPLTLIGSDSRSMKIGRKSAEGKPHPRTYGTFARILGHYVRKERVLTLEDAIAKMTGRPSAGLGLADRGTVEIGKKADLVLFFPERIRETSTFQDPHHYAEGIELVILNGRVVVDGDRHTGALAGRVLRRR